MKAIFCGTPEIAVPSLRALAEVAEIVGVVCQPDRPAGRGMKLRAPAVKEAAQEMGLSVHQPLKMRDGTFAAWMRERGADVAVVIAYGRILTADALVAPRLGCVNLHASLLPEYRGAAPIQRALMDGRTTTGVCLMQMDEGMDTGDVLSVRELPILPEHDAGSLARDLGELAAEVTRVDVPRFVRGELSPVPQDPQRATYAAPLTAADSILDFSRSARSLFDHIRGTNPNPGAKATLTRDGQPERRLRIIEAALTSPPSGLESLRGPLSPGRVLTTGGKIFLGTSTEPLELVRAQFEGKKVQAARDLINGRALVSGDLLK